MNSDWSKVYNYMKKKLEKQGRQETFCDKRKKERPSHSCQDITALGGCAVEHEPADKEDYVDLGLPSGTLWAKCNLGADNETDFGKFFQWGDTQGYKGIDEHQFNWGDYKYGSWNKLTKYNKNDNKLVLDNEDDPVFAVTNGKFKIPTKEQLQELIDCTNHRWVVVDCVNGMKFWKKGTEEPTDGDSYIFIPAAGDCFDGSHLGVGSWGSVWSASRDESSADNAWYMFFAADDVLMYFSSRCYGYSVRGVLNK